MATGSSLFARGASDLLSAQDAVLLPRHLQDAQLGSSSGWRCAVRLWRPWPLLDHVLAARDLLNPNSHSNPAAATPAQPATQPEKQPELSQHLEALSEHRCTHSSLLQSVQPQQSAPIVVIGRSAIAGFVVEQSECYRRVPFYFYQVSRITALTLQSGESLCRTALMICL